MNYITYLYEDYVRIVMSNIRNNYNGGRECLYRHICKALKDHVWNNHFCLGVQERLQSKKWLLAATLANALKFFIINIKVY